MLRWAVRISCGDWGKIGVRVVLNSTLKSVGADVTLFEDSYAKDDGFSRQALYPFTVTDLQSWILVL